jgi:hypothetical protein
MDAHVCTMMLGGHTPAHLHTQGGDACPAQVPVTIGVHIPVVIGTTDKSETGDLRTMAKAGATMWLLFA